MLHTLCSIPNLHHHPPFSLQFRTSHRENLRYLKTLGIIDSNSIPKSPDSVNQILTTVNFLKSKGFSDPDFATLSSKSPHLFSSTLDLTDIDPVFEFLALEVTSSAQESCGLILKCPNILFSDVEFCLKPTFNYLKQLGIQKLNIPNSLNAHLLNTRVEKLRMRIRFLRSIGLTYEESARVCGRFPAIFGYSAENNLEPKVEYLVDEMERSLEELVEFPQYFGFSLEKRIVPRHLHLKKRSLKLPLNRMLLWNDHKFYAKWNSIVY